MYLFAPWYFSERLKNGACLLPFISTNLFWSWFNILMELFVLYRVPFFHCWKLVVIFTSGIQNCYTILFKKNWKWNLEWTVTELFNLFFCEVCRWLSKYKKTIMLFQVDIQNTKNFVVSSWSRAFSFIYCTYNLG